MVRRRPPRKPEAPLSTFFSPPLPRLFAHRGLAIEAPENTLLAFASAVAVGAEYIETDVHSSADGVAVVAHDPDLRRMVGRDVRVEQLTMAELRKVDLGHGQAFCSLAEALDGFPETRFNIDLKSPGAVAPTVQSILAAGASRRVLVSSFDERRRASALRELPGVASSSSARRFVLALTAAKAGSAPAVGRALRGLEAVQVPEKALGMRVTTPRTIELLHGAGVEIHVWTVNSPARMGELLDLGIDGLVTDRIDLALEVVASRR